MNVSSDAAEQIVRISLEGFEVAAKVTGSSAKDIAILLYTIMKDKEQTTGKTNLTNMLKSGKELRVFSVKESELKKFSEEAKRYGVLYTALINKRSKTKDGIVDILVRAEDAAKIDRIVDRFKLSRYDKASIMSEIEKTKNKENLVLDMGKEKASPQLKNSLEMQKSLTQHSSIKKPSVKEKLSKIKKEQALNNKNKKDRVKKQIIKKDKVR